MHYQIFNIWFGSEKSLRRERICFESTEEITTQQKDALDSNLASPKQGSTFCTPKIFYVFFLCLVTDTMALNLHNVLWLFSMKLLKFFYEISWIVVSTFLFVLMMLLVMARAPPWRNLTKLSPTKGPMA